MSIGQTTLRAVPPDARANDLLIARDVLTTEAAALNALSASLGEAFCAAMDHHVARKIAATLSSTGTPALFVHPAEAAHGDLGMIIQGDAVIALSNSGEAAELAAIVAHASRIGLPLIGITSAPGSTLAQASTVALILPPAPEAGPIGLAPTTSTTMQMALGDALAVALLARRGFSASDFRDIHPGGKLGARLKRVRDLMHSGDELPLTAPGTTMDTALLTMTAKHFGCLGIAGPDLKLRGIITDGDLRRHMGPGLLGLTVDAIMTSNPRTIAPEALAEDALRLMNNTDRPVIALFVVDAAGMVTGILHIHDLLRAGLA
jgi:arabinose-5-phosphate isomerase